MSKMSSEPWNFVWGSVFGQIDRFREKKFSKISLEFFMSRWNFDLSQEVLPSKQHRNKISLIYSWSAHFRDYEPLCHICVGSTGLCVGVIIEKP